MMDNLRELQGLILGPYSTEFRSLKKTIAEALEESGIQPVLLEEKAGTGVHLLMDVQTAIERADFIIADLTGGNPNVMYEVGFAHALRRPLLIIVRRDVEQLPFDIRAYPFLIYDPSKPEDLAKSIRTWVTLSLTMPIAS
jgi:hypothetical protein